MNEFIEKLIGRLEELKELHAELIKDGLQEDFHSGCEGMCVDIIEIVNQLAEEHNNGWIACNQETPKKNGWYECWYMVSAICNNKEYEPMTMYWEDNLWLYHPRRFSMPTQMYVVAWKPIAPYNPKGE